ncbi:MAG: hypothetical protein K6G42_06235 [Lachnospiraceae bacterium]|nr:hypothetical protein [Lachnospiraceae bacterium]
MGNEGNLQIGDVKKKKESLNKTGGINTQKTVFNSNSGDAQDENPYALSGVTRVEELVNRGPLMATRIHTQNPNDIAFQKQVGKKKTGEGKKESTRVRQEENMDMIRAQPDLKVFKEDVMKKGAFTPAAKEAARHFFMQLSNWAGSFDDGGSGFYGSMGISTVLDCLYVDGMSLRNYVKEQYYYKTTNDPAHDMESLRNYVALIAARGDHIITLVRPKVKGNEAEVEYRNLYLDFSSVDKESAAKTKKQKEKGNQVRRNLKKRMESEMDERTGMAFRKAYGYDMDGYNRIEGAKKGIKDAGDADTEEYKTFTATFEKYNSGLQKLGLKPGRDDINLPVAKELKKRCSEALEAAEAFITSGSKNEAAVKAAKDARKVLKTDMKLLDDAINVKLAEEESRMKLADLLDSKKDGSADKGNDGDKGNGDNGDDGNKGDSDQNGNS